jgi:peptidoglycan/LPS O-acetylase OafA/YrhL
VGRGNHIYQIDALRGVAALLVAGVFHVHFLLGAYRTGPLDGLPFFGWVHQRGWTLVDLFFVISGYIFSHVYLNESGLKQGTTFRSFMKARLARLYPLHFVTLLLASALVPFGHPPTLDLAVNDAWHFLLNLLFLQESGLNQHMSFNTPAWSISVEMICYLVFIIAALAGKRVLLTVAACLVCVGLLATAGNNPHLDHIARGFVGYFAGHFLWCWCEPLRRVPVLALAVVAMAALLLPPKPQGISLGAYYSLTLWPCILLIALRLPALGSAPFRWLGDRSYSIYLLHAPLYILLSLAVFASGPVPRSYWVPAMVLSTALLLTLSDFSYRYLEYRPGGGLGAHRRSHSRVRRKPERSERILGFQT